MLKEVLATVDGSSGSMAAIDTAIEFVQYREARLQLSILFDQVPLLAAVEPSAYGYALQVNDDYRRADLSTIRDRISATAVGVDLHSFCLEASELVRAATAQARYADIALLGPSETWNGARLRRHVVEALILDAGMPTLLYHKGWNPALFRRAVIGWNGSAEAARAARALIPLMEAGARIDVVSVQETKDSEESSGTPGKNIGHLLARHGFEVELHLRQFDGESVTTILERFTRQHQADLLAIGAYDHSPLRERLLGGVTNDIIEDPRVPVLLVH